MSDYSEHIEHLEMLANYGDMLVWRPDTKDRTLKAAKAIRALQEQDKRLRSLLCRAYAKQPYLDDGELQDNSFPYPIDFKRDSVDEIETKMMARISDAIKAMDKSDE